MKPTPRCFTLIELLIVVAIIAILAAIAVPNFLEAQTRSKVSRAMNDMRTLAVAVEAQRTQTNALPLDYWDDDHQPAANERSMRCWGLPCRMNDRGGTMGLINILTTPVAYISSLPLDPFQVARIDESFLSYQEILPHPRTYLYIDEDPAFPGSDSGHYIQLHNFKPELERLIEGRFFFITTGPDSTYQRDLLHLYDPSNGTISRGDIIYSDIAQFGCVVPSHISW